ncbi:cell division protein FtsQ/DivIB [Arcticibacter tournemirensis]
MLKRIKWKRVLFAFIWLISLGGLVTLMSFISIRKSELKCSDLKVIIPGTTSFIDREEINRMVLESSGKLIGKPLSNINVQLVETVLKRNPYIRQAKVYIDMDGVVHLEIEQREPVLRIINFTNQDFYVDKDGFKIPYSSSYTPHVLVANGFIMESFNGSVDSLKTTVAKDLYKTASYMERDTLWKEQIEQMYVNEQKEIVLIPRVGDHRIVLGNADSLEVRLNNLLIFYKKAIPAVGWDSYKTINIKYTNQIVCEKNIRDSTNLAPVATDSSSRDTTKY